MNDLSLQEIQAFLNGDEEAAAKVYYAYRNLMYFIIASYVDNKDDCDDLLSESFLRVLEARESLTSGHGLKSYCASIARNLALSFLRKRNPTESFDEAYAPSEDSVSEIYEQLEPLLSKKEIMVLYYKAVFGYRWEEIVELTGIPSSTARLLYKQAKEKIRKESR